MVTKTTTRTALESAAAHGSVSYGDLTPDRLLAVLLGEKPVGGEFSQVYQALSETPLHRLATLSREIGLPFEDLKDRFAELYGERLEDAQQWKNGGH